MLKARYLPPPVSYEIGRADASGARFWVVCLWCTGLVAVLCWLLQQPQYWLIGLVALVPGTWAALLEVHRVAGLRLEWGYQGWHLSLNSSVVDVVPLPCEPRVIIDFQRVILLRVADKQRRIHWLWLAQRDKAQWHYLRCALFAVRQP